MENPKLTFSVIIPLYNRESYIASTLYSVLNQNFSSFEVIIVDDGSTDRSFEIAHSFTDPRIKVFTKENGGVSSARNTAIAEAKFKYLAFLDADDLWEPNYLEEMSALIKKFPGCGLYTSAHRISENSRFNSLGHSLPEGIINDYFKTELQEQITRLSASVVPASVIRSEGAFPVGMVSGEDSYFCAKIAINHKVAFTPKSLVVYNKRFSGIALRYGKIDKCTESWFNLLEDGNFYRNEFIADKAIKAGIRYALGSHRNKSIEIENLTRYTTYSRMEWKYLFILNRIPFGSTKFLRKFKPFIKMIKFLLKSHKINRQKLL